MTNTAPTPTSAPAPAPTPNPSDELTKAMEDRKKLDEKIEVLRKESRDAALAEVKRLCEVHEFYASDLKGSLKVKGATKTVRKSTRRRKAA